MGSAGLVVLLIGLSAAQSLGQCEPGWSDQFPGGGMDGSVITFAEFDDDGPGPNPAMLCAGGGFEKAEGLPAARVAAWNGKTWQALGAGVDGGSVLDLTVYDPDGDGMEAPSLYAGGHFANAEGAPAPKIARWDGAAWHPVGQGTNGTVYALRAIDWDGPGPGNPVLIVAGSMSEVYGFGPVDDIVVWNGESWAQLPDEWPGIDAIRALEVVDWDGPGPGLPVLWAGGDHYVGYWDGEQWITFEVKTNNVGYLVMDLWSGDIDGDGPLGVALYASGVFASIGGVSAKSVARFDGVAWSALGPGIDIGGRAFSVTGFDSDGDGPIPPNIICAGDFPKAGGQSVAKIARWDGSSWSPLGSGLTDRGLALHVREFAPAGPGPRLFVGGEFAKAGGGDASSVAIWSGEDWYGISPGPGDLVTALALWDKDGVGPSPSSVYVGGGFTRVDHKIAAGFAAWDGAGWSILPGTDDFIASLTIVHPEQAGLIEQGLYACGDFTQAGETPASNIARWDATQWHALGGGLGGDGRCMVLCDHDGDGPGLPLLYVGGDFLEAGGISASGIAAWDGASWSDVGGGVDDQIYDLVAWDDDGDGPRPLAVYATGVFKKAGGSPAAYIARWDGQQWETLGSGLDYSATSLEVFDAEGAGRPILWVGGGFYKPGGIVTGNVASWDGATWAAPSDDPEYERFTGGVVWALGIVDIDGGGPLEPALHAAGDFDKAGDTLLRGLARWDGQAWAPIGGGLDRTTWTFLGVTDDPDSHSLGNALFVGGSFDEAGGIPSGHFARWGGCPEEESCYPDLTEDGTLDLFDFLAFVNLFNAQDSDAECDGNGVYDLFDFLCFVNAFNDGC